MLRVLTDLFESLKSTRDADAPGAQHALELATAVLLVEVSRADGHFDDAEREVVMAALRSKFTLTDRELEDLCALATARSEEAHDLYAFTSRLNEALDEPRRVRVFQLLWQVAFADGTASAHETHLLRRLADLLHIRHGDAVRARLAAEPAS